MGTVQTDPNKLFWVKSSFVCVLKDVLLFTLEVN